MADIERGVREMEILTEYLNRVITMTGKPIERDNHSLWKKFFHHWNNEDWDNMITALEAIKEHYPEAFERFHTQALVDAREVLAQESSKSARILDTKPYKTRAWKMAMAIREVINNINGVNIPNGTA
jgi:hypothetical protein